MPPDTTPPDQGNQYLLGQIAANITHLLESQSKHRAEVREFTKDIHKRIDGHEHRISKVEQGAWKIAGVAASVPAALTIGGLVLAYMKG